MSNKQIKVGCCGWCKPHADYFEDFKVIEIQKTFYQPPARKSTLERWRKKAPDDFEFVIKAWQLITHPPKSPTYRKLRKQIPSGKKENYGYFQPTPEVFKAWQKMDQIAQILNSKVILFQTPSSFEPTLEHRQNLTQFFQQINGRDYTLVWEPRGDWKPNQVKEICKAQGLVHGVDPFKQSPTTGEINYFRLHGKPGYNLRYKYTKQDLKRLKSFCNKKISYVMFNNVSMKEDAQNFLELQEGLR